MDNIIFLLQKESDYSKFEDELTKFTSPKIFSLDYEAHIYLENNHIKHEIADNLLSEHDLAQIDDLTLYFIQNWIPQKSQKDFSLDNIFLPSLLDHELFFYLLPIFSITTIIKKIIEKEKPAGVIDFTQFSEFTEALLEQKDIIKKFIPKTEKAFHHDKITVDLSPMKIPLNLKISRKTFDSMKRVSGKIIERVLDNNRDYDDARSVLLVNFDPIKYDLLLKQFKKQEINVILYNPRKPAVTNLKSLNVVRESGSKIFDVYGTEKFLGTEIKINELKFTKSFEDLFSNTQHFHDILGSDYMKIWNSIKISLHRICLERSKESIKRILVLSKFFERNKIKLILQWAEVGQEEKECMKVGKNFNIPSFMLQHGRFLTSKKWTRFADFTGHFPNKKISDGQFVWGDLTKEFGRSQGYEQKNIFAIGSPRHDKFFIETKDFGSSKKILLATSGAVGLSADTCTTNSQLRHDMFIREINRIVKKLPNKEMIVRTHPSDKVTEYNKKLFKKINPQIPFANNIDLIELIQDSELVIAFNNSTICLDAITLGKPVISIQTEDSSLDEEIVQNDGILSVQNIDECETSIKKILYDTDYRNDILKKSKSFLDKYLANQGNASKTLVNTIMDLI